MRKALASCIIASIILLLCYVKLKSMDVPTLDGTTEQTVVLMSIVDTVTWKRAPVRSVNLGTSATGVNQNAQMENMENNARIIVVIAEI